MCCAVPRGALLCGAKHLQQLLAMKSEAASCASTQLEQRLVLLGYRNSFTQLSMKNPEDLCGRAVE